jgi:hypothetical protein
LFTLPPGRGIEADVRPTTFARRHAVSHDTHRASEFARRRVDVILDFPAQLKGLEKKGISQ